jgi:hypothetical protein
MATTVAKLADRVFTTVMAPLVLGGTVAPARPLGARAALAFVSEGALPSDSDLASRVDLARVASARRLAPVDRVADPSGADWALAAALHDLLQVASPSWRLRGSATRLLDLVRATLERIAPPATAHEALMRHTWFARVLTLKRKDATVSWWTGSREYRGEEPAARLLAWPDLRRVHVTREERAITELVARGGVATLAEPWNDALGRFLRATPLTDLATCARATPKFEWSEESLAITRSPVARTLALRAIAHGPDDETDAALGRATRALVASRSWRDANDALDLLAHRALAAAQSSASWPGVAGAGATEDIAFARAAGALVARQWLDSRGSGLALTSSLTPSDRARIGSRIDAASRAPAAEELRALAGAGVRR